VIERGRGGFEFERLPEILGWRSFCPGCKKSKKIKNATLTAWQLIPLVGWLAQWGKCFRCKKSIPGWYQVVEWVMWLLFVLVTWLFVGNQPSILLLDSGIVVQHLIFWLFVVRAAGAIVLADMLWYELNVWLRLFLMVWILVWWLTWLFPIGDGVLRMLVFVAIYVGIYQFGKRYVKRVFGEDGEWFGQWDVMLAAVVWLLFPFLVVWLDRIAQVQMVFVYLVMSSFVGMVFWYIRLLITKDKDNMMPFLPAMIVGFVILLVWWTDLVAMLTI
jgi:prepilin signal peptidase PulO-like enzyme (type II secretory pathway)